MFIAGGSLALAIKNQHRLTEEKIDRIEPDKSGIYHVHGHERANDFVIEKKGFIAISKYTDEYSKQPRRHFFCSHLECWCTAGCPRFDLSLTFKRDRETPVFCCQYYQTLIEARKFIDENETKGPES